MIFQRAPRSTDKYSLETEPNVNCDYYYYYSRVERVDSFKKKLDSITLTLALYNIYTKRGQREISKKIQSKGITWNTGELNRARI